MAEKEYIEREAAYDMDTLYDWYISSVSENDNPVWTEEHLEELLNDFYVIPKDTPTADVVEVVRCKDCEYLLKDLSEREAHLCMRNRFIRGRVNLDDFCSYGERKELDNGKT